MPKEQRAAAGQRRIVLLSGGLDSTVLLHRLHSAEESPTEYLFPLFVDYAQRAVRQEREAADWHCRHLGLKLKVLDVHALGVGLREEQTLKLHLPLPERNLVLFAVAINYAAVIGAQSIAIALIADDTEVVRRAASPVLGVLSEMAMTLANVQIETPLLTFTKTDVFAESSRLGVPPERTYSCMVGRGDPCGRCQQCLRRAAAAEQFVTAASQPAPSGAR